MIPILIASDEKTDLVDLVDEIGERGQKIGLVPFLANSPAEAEEYYGDIGPRMLLAVLGTEGQATYDRLRSAGYRGDVLVCDKETDREKWEKRDVEFIDPSKSPAQVYARIEEKLVE